MSCPECARKTQALNDMQAALDNAVGTLKDLEAARTRDAREISALKSRITKSHTEGQVGEQVKEVYDFWVRLKGMSKADPNSKLGEKRLSKVRARLAEGFTVDQLKSAVEGAVRYPYWAGPGVRAAFPKRAGDSKNDDLTYICRDETTVPKLIELVEKGPPAERKPERHLRAVPDQRQGQVVKRDPWQRPLDRAVAALRREFGADSVWPSYRSEDSSSPQYWDVEWWGPCPFHPTVGAPLRLREFGWRFGGRIEAVCAKGCLPSLVLAEIRKFEWRRVNGEICAPPDELVERWAQRSRDLEGAA